MKWVSTASLLLAPAILASPLLAGSLTGTVKILNKDGKFRDPVKDVIAILEPLNAPRPKVTPRPLLRVKTHGKKFVPRVAWTTPGSSVVFPNQDSIIHNVFSVCCAQPFDTGQYEPGDSPRTTLTKPGLVKLYCNVHHKMNAFVWVLETPYAQVLDNNRSTVDFANLPSGTYRLKLWHPETGEQTYPITIHEGVTRGDWTLGATLPPFETHKNKFGKDYPPAKDEGSY
jgi:hypothetical protein